MIENDACSLLQKSDYSSSDRWVAISRRGKKVRKWSQVNQERPFEFTMNTSTWFKKCFNQDFIFCKYVLSSEYELFISTTPFWARFSSGMKRCPTFPASFQGFLWFTSMTLEDSGFGIWGLAETLFGYRWFRCVKVWSSHCAFADIFFYFNTWNYSLFLNEEASFSYMKICYEFLYD